MEPSKQSRGGKDLFRERLDAIIDLKHPLVRLAGLMPWSDFDAAFGRFYKPLGRRAKPTRPMIGLPYLKHTLDLSDELTVERWVDNPSRQSFCGLEFLEHAVPIDPSLMSRWRKRIDGPQFVAGDPTIVRSRRLQVQPLSWPLAGPAGPRGYPRISSPSGVYRHFVAGADEGLRGGIAGVRGG